MKRATLVVNTGSNNNTPCTQVVGTKLLNLCTLAALPFATQYIVNEDCKEVTRVISLDIGIITTRKMLSDLAECNVSHVISNYYAGEYTEGEVPTYAWYLNH